MTRFLICFAIFSACGPTGKRVAVDIAACAVEQVAAQIPALLPEVEAALVGTEVDWQAEIARLESAGVNLAICAVQAAVNDLSAKRAHAAGSAFPAIDYGIARGRSYVRAKGSK